MNYEDVIKKIKGFSIDVKDITPPAGQKGFFVFYSFDLVNSTQYKSVNNSTWPTVINKFYEVVETSLKLKNRMSNVKLWKYIGDEILLYQEITTAENLTDCVPNAYIVLNDVIDGLYRQFNDCKIILSVKATVWCAEVAYFQPQDLAGANMKLEREGIKNITFVSSLDYPNTNETKDFLGPDIDLGFRLAKYSQRKRLIISSDLAFLLYKIDKEKFSKSLKIVSYEQLKGIWDGRRCPIIWYEKEWGKKAILKSFLYDERYESFIVNRIVTDFKSLEKIETLEKIYDDLDKSQVIIKLFERLQKGEFKELSDTIKPDPQIPLSRLTEVHCVAVCFNNKGKILIAKRPASKRRYPRHWEFGCGQLKRNETFEKCLNRAYKEDFKIDLDFKGKIRPICTYSIPDAEENREIPGIIFIAIVVNPSAAEKSEKHSAITWLDPVDTEFSKREKCVPDFAKTVALAKAAWQAL